MIFLTTLVQAQGASPTYGDQVAPDGSGLGVIAALVVLGAAVLTTVLTLIFQRAVRKLDRGVPGPDEAVTRWAREEEQRRTPEQYPRDSRPGRR